jgi:hypothetical protein
LVVSEYVDIFLFYIKTIAIAMVTVSI